MQEKASGVPRKGVCKGYQWTEKEMRNDTKGNLKNMDSGKKMGLGNFIAKEEGGKWWALISWEVEGKDGSIEEEEG